MMGTLKLRDQANAAWVALRGPRGLKGATGDKGDKGDPGDTGPPGPNSSMTLIEEKSLSGLSTVTFSNIPQTYQELLLVFEDLKSTLTSTVSSDLSLKFNGDATNSYAYMGTSAGSVVSANSQPALRFSNGIPSSYSTYTDRYGSGIVRLTNYTSTKKTKHILMNEIVSGISTGLAGAGIWHNPNPITSIEVFMTNVFTSDGSVKLYGVK